MLQKNDLCQIRIEDTGMQGEGIGKYEGFTLFVKDAVPGDLINCRIMKMKKTYGYARLVNVIEPSVNRVSPLCSLADKCGGCQIAFESYEAQLRFKENKVREDLKRLGGFSVEQLNSVFHPIIGMADPYRYRNKTLIPIGLDKKGNPVAGFYAGHTHSIIPVSDCMISHEINKTVLQVILHWVQASHIHVYNEKEGTGLLRNVLIRQGYHSGQIMVCLVTNGETMPHYDKLVDQLKEIPGMTSISQSVNTDKTNVVMGRDIHTLWGSDSITDSIQIYDVNPAENQSFQFSATTRMVSFHISPLSFYQVNPIQTEKLYSIVRYFAGLTGRETIWDLYCGVGTISLFLAQNAAHVYGVEVVEKAVHNARENAALNHIDNARYETGKVEEVLPNYVKDHGTADVVIVDPPRKGCDERTLHTILAVMPKKVIYVSCDPATLARDLKILCNGGYDIKAIQPVDMFPHTVHVETVVSLQRKSD